jgi:hypothetical protein
MAHVVLPGQKWPLPPKAKVYEALSAVADKRVSIVAAHQAQVTSSSGDKKYLVEWSADARQITSNDNASYWQGYAGYPIIAALLALGRLAAAEDVVQHFAGIHWKALNKEYKNNYDSAVTAVLASLSDKGVDAAAIRRTIDDIYTDLRDLALEKLETRRPPPAGLDRATR